MAIRMIGPAFTSSCGLAYEAKFSSNKGSQNINLIAPNAEERSPSKRPNINPPNIIVKKTAIIGVRVVHSLEILRRFSSLIMSF
jgi:hypothetical protein